jgi:hypothetical protein
MNKAKSIPIPLSHSSKIVQIPRFDGLLYTPDRYKRRGTAPQKNKVKHKLMKRGQSKHLKIQEIVLLTFRTHCTIMVPVVGHSSKVSACISMSSHFNRYSSSQKKSLTNSGVASSNNVRLRYCGGPV